MSDLLDQAVEVLRTLPESMQESVARTIIEQAATFEESSIV